MENLLFLVLEREGVFVFEVVFYLYRVVVCSIYRKVSFNITKPRFYLPCIT
nr:MAG TPA: hypothetical protein [Caudoviricetes sp.]